MKDVLRYAVKVFVTPLLEMLFNLSAYTFGLYAAIQGKWWGWVLVVFAVFVFYLNFSLAAIFVQEKPDELK